MLKIGALAECAGISRDTLRFYEKHGLITPSNRTDSGYRLYSKSDVLRISFKKSVLRSMKYISCWNWKSPKIKNLAKM